MRNNTRPVFFLPKDKYFGKCIKDGQIEKLGVRLGKGVYVY
jgi:hypothetical protein